VSPRDGLQSVKAFIPTQEKVRLIEALISAGLPKIEVTSFVSPKWIPQLADAEHLIESLRKESGTIFQALVLNEKGFQRARRTNLVKEITFVVASTEALNRKNVNMSIADSMRQFASIAKLAKADGIRPRGLVGVAFVCPHEGRVPTSRVLELIEKFFTSGAEEVTLADSLGAAAPDHVYDLFVQAKETFPDKAFAAHFHDTQHLALANIFSAMCAGIDVFEAAVGELGGCPFTAGARGNVATERLVYMLHSMGIETGIDYDQLVKASAFAHQLVSSPSHEAQSAQAGLSLMQTQ